MQSQKGYSINHLRFESLVNLKGCKASTLGQFCPPEFESLVNLKGCKACRIGGAYEVSFESLVNLKGCKAKD